MMTKATLALCLLLASAPAATRPTAARQPRPQPSPSAQQPQPPSQQQQPPSQQPQPPSAPRPAAAGTPVKRGRLTFAPCDLGERAPGATCARYEVFENRETRQGRKIGLNVVLLPSFAAQPAPDPVFYFVGGPGASATESARAPIFGELRRARDVVFIDQRGTGGSNPLRCEMYGAMPDYFTGDVFPAARVRACRAELEQRADLRHYTTPVAMADADELREAMGYERVNVNGASYGSTAALAYLRLYPRRVRTAAVFGVAPVDFKMALPFARGVEQSLERLFTDCAADEQCRTAFPELRREFRELYDRLGKAPAVFEVAEPRTGARHQITLTRAGLMEHMRAMLYQPALQSTLPVLIHDMHGGSYERFAALAYDYFRRLESSIARGMHLSVVCTESVPYTTEEDIKRETAGTFYGEARLRAYQRACADWPRGSLPKDYREPTKTDVPVLMLSGELDPATPPWAATAALPQYARGRQVLLPNAAHAPYECVDRLMLEFIERGTADNLNVACATQIRRRPFVLTFPQRTP